MNLANEANDPIEEINSEVGSMVEERLTASSAYSMVSDAGSEYNDVYRF